MNWITIGIGLPLTLIVIIAVFSQVKRDQGAPVYVINLLFADLIQLCSRIPVNSLSNTFVSLIVWNFSLLASVGFMICISFERYLVIAMPLWYRFRRNIKTSVVVCVVVWILSLLFSVFAYMSPVMVPQVLAVSLLVPFPLFIFFLVGTFKTLSGALSVPADEKRRIIAIQVVVLLIYALLFLPITAYFLLDNQLDNEVLGLVTLVCMFLSPLADTTLYLFIRKSVLDMFLVSLCSCKISNNQQMSSRDCENTTVPNTETV
ncbi:mas-related G-protein coupled receptor member X1-like [Girardinichthys multiradiatus]|uniref:mas-related G-protein coupled receptor member X1-like n=1 Tax=Girardinichthys multiradiatus TaxID=208333 RepID=UPI001FAC8C19|nr:mas-related G-protein coupled receptor member X1-like [Girardinichthys multiradiatus]